MNRRPKDRTPNSVSRRPSGPRGASPFVGRDGELRRLTTSLTLAAEGQGGVVFLTGQPGIGKTRLAREALCLAKETGFSVLEGRALPLEGELAYAPILNAFGSLLRNLEPDHLATLVDGLPDLGRLFGGLQLPPPEPLGDPAIEKTRLFEAVSRLLERLTQKAPVALFIDDLHWADPATLDLLHYLARGFSDLRALLLATYNEDASNSSRGLLDLIGSLDRGGLVEEIVVPRLKPDAVDKLVRGILGGEAPRDLLALLDIRAGGTPLFVEALIAALIDSGHLVRRPSSDKDGWFLAPDGTIALAPSVRRLILRRLRRLEQADRRVLDLIAIMGDAASHPILRLASGLEDESLLESLSRLHAAGLVAEGKDGLDVAYSITHSLVQQVVYAELPEMVRRRAHLAVIEAIESFSAGRPEDVHRLAHHYRGAGTEAKGDRALAALLAAGERSLYVYANEEAARHLDAALAMLRGGQGLGTLSPPYPLSPDREEPLLPWLLERLGEAWERIGKRAAAVEVWNEALASRELAGDAVAASRLRCQLALAEMDRGNFDVAKAHAEAGLATLAGHEPCQELGDLHFARSYILGRIGDVAGVAETAAELLALAEEFRSPRTEAEANLVASLPCLWTTDVARSRQHALHALTVAEQAQELAICYQAHAVLVLTGVRLGDHQLTISDAERGLGLARRLGAPNMGIVFCVYTAHARFISGAWEESLRYGMESVALARRVGYPRDLAFSLAQRAMVVALRGDLRESEACISEAQIAFGSPSKEGPADIVVSGLTDIAEATLALERGQVERALAISRRFVRHSESATAPAILSPPFMPVGLALLAEVQVSAGEPERALETARALAGLGPIGTPYLAALASRAEGIAWLALGQREAALTCLTQALETFTTLQIPFEAAKSLLDLAVSATTEEPELAVRRAQQSLAIFERLGAQRYAEGARRLLGGFGILPIPTRQPRLGGIAVSPRELEIARLVTEGLTTAEIANRLILSPGTVNTHLHRIYTRLGINSRAGLARLVVEAGLLSAPSHII